jgi:hypothetical protein
MRNKNSQSPAQAVANAPERLNIIRAAVAKFTPQV